VVFSFGEFESDLDYRFGEDSRRSKEENIKELGF
jgi:hypothetical protein